MVQQSGMFCKSIFRAERRPMKTEQSGRLKKQWLLIILCCFAYSFAYAGRYSYNANIAPIMDFYGITRADAGLVGTFFFFAYGVGQFVNAVLCRFYHKKYIIAGALLLSSAINVALFFHPPFEAVKYLWLFNGACQSILWPTLILTLGEALDQSMVKCAVLFMSFSVLIGTFLAYGGSALFNLGAGFRYTFLLGAIPMVAVGIVWFLSYRALTERTVPIEMKKTESEKKQSHVSGGMTGALLGLLIVCAVFAVVDNFVKDGLNTWMPVILKEQYGFGDSISILFTLVLPLFGVFGSILALSVNRKIKDFRLLIGLFYLILCVFMYGIMLSVRQNASVPFLICQGFIACFAHGINGILVSIMPLALREKINSGFLAGAMNASCYIGSTASAYGLGRIADGSGWNRVTVVLLAASVAATVLAGFALTAWLLRRKKREA